MTAILIKACQIVPNITVHAMNRPILDFQSSHVCCMAGCLRFILITSTAWGVDVDGWWRCWWEKRNASDIMKKVGLIGVLLLSQVRKILRVYFQAVINVKSKCKTVPLFAGKPVIRVSFSCESYKRGRKVHERSATFKFTQNNRWVSFFML